MLAVQAARWISISMERFLTRHEAGGKRRRKMSPMTVRAAPRLFLLFASLALGASKATPTGHVEVVPALSLQGEGCHRMLLDSDGGLVCHGVVVDHGGYCEAVESAVELSDGGTRWAQLQFGSRCQPPQPSFASIGAGLYFVQTDGDHSYLVLCDNALGHASNSWREIHADCVGPTRRRKRAEGHLADGGFDVCHAFSGLRMTQIDWDSGQEWEWCDLRDGSGSIDCSEELPARCFAGVHIDEGAGDFGP
jgi:hypothetical protein